LSITNCTKLNIEWNIGKDPMGSNLIIISISKKFKVSSKKLYDSDKLIKNKPKMSLKNLDEEFFSLLVLSHTDN